MYRRRCAGAGEEIRHGDTSLCALRAFECHQNALNHAAEIRLLRFRQVVDIFREYLRRRLNIGGILRAELLNHALTSTFY
nr:MAG TPA: hypothetical protein [Caudoviricetes sp.]